MEKDIILNLFKDILEGNIDKKWVQGFLVALILVLVVLSFTSTPIKIKVNTNQSDIFLNTSTDFPSTEGPDGTTDHKYTLTFENFENNSDANCMYTTKIKYNEGKYVGQEIIKRWGNGKNINIIEFEEFRLELDQIFLRENKLTYTRTNYFVLSPFYYRAGALILLLLLLWVIKKSSNPKLNKNKKKKPKKRKKLDLINKLKSFQKEIPILKSKSHDCREWKLFKKKVEIFLKKDIGDEKLTEFGSITLSGVIPNDLNEWQSIYFEQIDKVDVFFESIIYELEEYN